jgi:hypothetical protein
MMPEAGHRSTGMQPLEGLGMSTMQAGANTGPGCTDDVEPTTHNRMSTNI